VDDGAVADVLAAVLVGSVDVGPDALGEEVEQAAAGTATLAMRHTANACLNRFVAMTHLHPSMGLSLSSTLSVGTAQRAAHDSRIADEASRACG